MEFQNDAKSEFQHDTQAESGFISGMGPTSSSQTGAFLSEVGPIPGIPPTSSSQTTGAFLSEVGPIPGTPPLAPQMDPSSSVQLEPTESNSPVQLEPVEGAAAPMLTETDYQKAIAPLKPQSAMYWVSLVLTGNIVPLPIAATIITATLYITRPDWLFSLPFLLANALVVLLGMLGTFLLWLFLSWLFKRFTVFETANARSASHLRCHIIELKSALKLLHEQLDYPDDAERVDKTLRAFRIAHPQDYELALDTLCSCLIEINRRVGCGNLSWIVGSGYTDVWNFVQRAEEALLAVAPREYVIREALHDEAAVDGSAITDGAYILSNTKTAIKTLSSSASVYLKSLSVQDRVTVPTDASGTNNTPIPVTVATLPNSVLDPTIELEARNALRDVRQTLNEFRSGLWEGLVALRNQLVSTALITALLTYALLFVAIGADINVEAMKAALVFYLVGAIVGLFSRLHTESQNDSAVDDYGLTIARVVVTPLVSGLAALAGVLVIAALSINILNAPGTAGSGGLPQLVNVYDIVQNRQGIIIASLFGLTPNLLMNILQQKADDAKVQLKNSGAPSQSAF